MDMNRKLSTEEESSHFNDDSQSELTANALGCRITLERSCMVFTCHSHFPLYAIRCENFRCLAEEWIDISIALALEGVRSRVALLRGHEYNSTAIRQKELLCELSCVIGWSIRICVDALTPPRRRRRCYMWCSQVKELLGALTMAREGSTVLQKLSGAWWNTIKTRFGASEWKKPTI